MKNALLITLFSLLVVAELAAQTAPPYWNDIMTFKKQDSVQAPPFHPILFVGSSSITKWTGLNEAFQGYPVLNRGFGGSTLLDLIRYSYDVIIPYQPKQVVIFCGENDLAYSDSITAEEVVTRFKTLFSIIRMNLPDAVINYISIKPSPTRKNIRGKVLEVNKGIKAFMKKQRWAGYIDVYSSMVDSYGYTRGELFVEDSLHMTPEGYAVWKRNILPYLIK